MDDFRAITGTDINKVKEKNSNSGMSYNEAKEFIARTTGGHHTNIYSDTDIQQVRKKLRNSKKG
ncbi:gamma-type small acid-soluble spore protein [Radiobacillus deserti]|uniref:Gamma-type small acid-soluble spore protein n=1 Tax=Radiobacillus deserti TaxID=2594883 RepID=A0A516KK12_9BACI|nr:gamma-type small acid-soluble spore protein [Radiobacillus deserti]QDP41729.1 gamma-type small acid-soluble spore protein [Radiobacillus deserti]